MGDDDEKTRLLQYLPRDIDLYLDKGHLCVAWAERPPSIWSDDAAKEVEGRGSIQTMKMSEFTDSLAKGSEKDVGAWYEQLGFATASMCPWNLPGPLDTPLEDWEKMTTSGGLIYEVAGFVDKYVRLPKEVSSLAIAAWILASAVPEIAEHAPPLVFFGPHGVGKSRALKAIKAIGRRTLDLAAPSPASLYALTDIYQPTMLVDEWTKVPPDVRRATETILRIGFDRHGGYIPRRKERSEGVKFWRAFSFYAIGSQEPLPDDVMDRCLPIFMSENQDVPDIAESAEEAVQLRTALCRYRLERLAGTRKAATNAEARAAVKAALKAANRRVSDRGMDKVEPLASVALPYDQVDAVVEILLVAHEAGQAAFQDSIPGTIVRAIENLYKSTPHVDGIPCAIPLQRVHDQIWQDLQNEDGFTMKQLEMHDPVLPTQLGGLIRTLGYRTKRQSKGMVIEDPELAKKSQMLLWKYGMLTKPPSLSDGTAGNLTE
jgi:hypothetical protein